MTLHPQILRTSVTIRWDQSRRVRKDTTLSFCHACSPSQSLRSLIRGHHGNTRQPPHPSLSRSWRILQSVAFLSSIVASFSSCDSGARSPSNGGRWIGQKRGKKWNLVSWWGPDPASQQRQNMRHHGRMCLNQADETSAGATETTASFFWFAETCQLLQGFLALND